MSVGFSRQNFGEGEVERSRAVAQLRAELHQNNAYGSGFERNLNPNQLTSSNQWKLGIDPIDACLPESSLDRAGLHELIPFQPKDMPSLTGFAFGLLSRLGSCLPIIWCVTAEQVGDYGQLYAFGLERFGISPAQIIFVKVKKALDLHFALEEAVKTEGVAAVIGEGAMPSFTGSRRLSLLCKTHQRPCLLMSSKHEDALGSISGSAAATRWQIEPQQSAEDPRDPFGPGLPTWRIGLPRARGGKTMPSLVSGDERARQQDMPHHSTNYPWRIVWDDQTLCFRPSAVFSNGTLSQNAGSHAARAASMVGQRQTRSA